MDETCCKAPRLQPLDSKHERSPSPLDLGPALTDDEILTAQTDSKHVQETFRTYDRSTSCTNENHMRETPSGYPHTMS